MPLYTLYIIHPGGGISNKHKALVHVPQKSLTTSFLYGIEHYNITFEKKHEKCWLEKTFRIICPNGLMLNIFPSLEQVLSFKQKNADVLFTE